MVYALLKTVHMLAVIGWLGGMFFVLFCLRPALPVLDAPQRVRLMHAALLRFLNFAFGASLLTLFTGLWMIGRVAKANVQAGGSFTLSIELWLMVVLGTLMVAIVGHVRFALFGRLRRAVAAESWPQGAAALDTIRRWVGVNLALGVFVVVAVMVGGSL